jgi:GNAT superfamily N-acetyltransferase
MQSCIRQLEHSDRRAYLEGFASLSPSTRYLRFAGPKPRLTAGEVRYLLDVDHADHEALVAYDCATGRPAGVGRYVRVADAPDTAEVALTVLDAWQGRGVGPRLLDELAARAAEHGVTRLRADVLRSNDRVLRLARRAGWRAVRTDGAMLTLERPLPLAEPAPERAPAPPAARAVARTRRARPRAAAARRRSARSGS